MQVSHQLSQSREEVRKGITDNAWQLSPPPSDTQDIQTYAFFSRVLKKDIVRTDGDDQQPTTTVSLYDCSYKNKAKEHSYSYAFKPDL